MVNYSKDSVGARMVLFFHYLDYPTIVEELFDLALRTKSYAECDAMLIVIKRDYPNLFESLAEPIMNELPAIFTNAHGFVGFHIIELLEIKSQDFYSRPSFVPLSSYYELVYPSLSIDEMTGIKEIHDLFVNLATWFLYHSNDYAQSDLVPYLPYINLMSAIDCINFFSKLLNLCLALLTLKSVSKGTSSFLIMKFLVPISILACLVSRSFCMWVEPSRELSFIDYICVASSSNYFPPQERELLVQHLVKTLPLGKVVYDTKAMSCIEGALGHVKDYGLDLRSCGELKSQLIYSWAVFLAHAPTEQMNETMVTAFKRLRINFLSMLSNLEK